MNKIKYRSVSIHDTFRPGILSVIPSLSKMQYIEETGTVIYHSKRTHCRNKKILKVIMMRNLSLPLYSKFRIIHFKWYTTKEEFGVLPSGP